MAKKRYNAEEIIHKLREAQVLLAQGSMASVRFHAIARQILPVANHVPSCQVVRRPYR